MTASLATAAYRLPQRLNAFSEWLRAETTAGRIADDRRRSPDQLTARIGAVTTHAADSAAELALPWPPSTTSPRHSTPPSPPHRLSEQGTPDHRGPQLAC